jgi:hypothetical protein
MGDDPGNKLPGYVHLVPTGPIKLSEAPNRRPPFRPIPSSNSFARTFPDNYLTATRLTGMYQQQIVRNESL